MAASAERLPPLRPPYETDPEATPLLRFVRRLFAPAWPSHLLLFLFQLKVLWRIWELRDLTSGDTASYFASARLWAESLRVNVVWSPAYTAFYGTIAGLAGDPYLATTAHRMLLVFAVGAGALALLRCLVAPHVALLAACWWTALPIVFNTLYEVHLFALLPILLYWLLALHDPPADSRRWALALLVAASVLVRNELGLAAAVAAALLAFFEWRASRRGGAPFRRRALGYLVPLLVALALCAGAYARSTIRLPELRVAMHVKHALNMCQVYAFGHQQRHPEWRQSPWTGCAELARATFGVETPTVTEMLIANPRALAAHVAWNARLIPAGAELLVFNATASPRSPDYTQVHRALWPRVLGLLALAIVSWQLVARLRGETRNDAIRRSRREALLVAFVPLLVVALPVALLQRPRASYFLHLGLLAIGATCWAIDRSLRSALRSQRRGRSPSHVATAVVVLVLGMIAFWTPHFERIPSARPLRAKVERLSKHSGELATFTGPRIVGEFAFEAPSYAGLTASPGRGSGSPPAALSNEVWREWDRRSPFGRFLAERGIEIAYLDEVGLSRIETDASARQFLAVPELFGFRVLDGGNARGDRWRLLVRAHRR